MFKVGDKIRRIDGYCGSMPMGQETEIVYIVDLEDEYQSLGLKGFENLWYSYNFEKVEQ